MKKSDLYFAFILLPIDIVMIIAAFILSYYFRLGLESAPTFNDIGIKEYLKYGLYLIPIWLILFSLNGLYYVRSTGSFLGESYRIFSASSTAMLFLIVFIFLSRSLFFSRLIFLFTWSFSIALLILGRLVIRLIRQYLLKFGIGRINTLLIGDNRTSETITYQLARQKSDHKTAGVISRDGSPSDLGLKILGTFDDIDEVIEKHQIDEIILTDPTAPRKELIKIAQICYDKNLVFKYVPDTFSLLSLNVSTGTIGSMPVFQLRSTPLDGWGRITKRAFDLSFSGLFLLILSPIFLIIAALVKLTSPGPVFFAQERISRDRRKFHCHKFRSMVNGAQEKQAWTNSESENLVTPIGSFLRKSNLDEIPQLWDILIGNMSFVGPRPEQPQFVEKFEKEIPDYFRRHKVKSGLTGWAQVNGLKGDTSIEERVRHDMYYIENWSFWLDIKILIKTLFVIIYELFKGKYEYRTRP